MESKAAEENLVDDEDEDRKMNSVMRTLTLLVGKKWIILLANYLLVHLHLS